MDIKQYWKSIVSKAAEFDPEAAEKDRNEMNKEDQIHLRSSKKEIYLVSVDNPEKGSVGGRVVTAFPYVAAQMLQAQTHVLANERQKEAHIADLEARRLQIAADERKRVGSTVPPEMVELAKAASMLAAAAQQPTQKRGN